MQVATKELAKHSLPTGLMALDVAADGETAWAGALDGLYRIRLEDGSHEKIAAHKSYVSGVALFDGGKQCVTSGYDGALIWHDLSEKRTLRELQAHSFWSWDLAASADGKYVATVSGQYLAGDYKYTPAEAGEPTVKLFEAASGELVHAWEMRPSVQAVAISLCNRYVAAGNLMGDVAVWDIATGDRLAAWNTEAFTSWGIIKSHCYIGGIHALRFSPDSESVIAAGMGPMRDPMAGNGRQLWQRFAWRENPARLIDETHKGESGEGLMETLALHPGGQLFVMSGRLRGGQWNTGFFSLADGKRIHSLSTGYRVTEARFTPDGQRLLLAGMANQGKLDEAFGRLHVYEVKLS